MDPYKILQLPPTADLEACRQKAKNLFKRYMQEDKNKFDAKKVLEAFEMVKRAKKKAHSSNTQQVLGRSRKERELDGLFNKQTKKIDKTKKRNREKQRMLEKQIRRRGGSASGKAQMLAMRDKFKRSSRRSGRRRTERPMGPAAPPPRKKAREGPIANDPLDALYKIIQHLPVEKKFQPAMNLLHRWITEVMKDPEDCKEHLFYALQTAFDTGFVVSRDADRRAVVMKVFRYVLLQRSWFATPAEERLRTVWDLGVVTQNEMYSDDSFEFNAAIGRLKKALATFPTEEERDAQYEREERERAEASASAGPTPGPSPASPGPDEDEPRTGPALPPATPHALASPEADDEPAQGPAPPPVFGPQTQADELAADWDAPDADDEPPTQGPAPPPGGGRKRARSPSDDGNVVDVDEDRSDSGSEDGSDDGSRDDGSRDDGSDGASDGASDAGNDTKCEAWRPPTEEEAEDLQIIGYVDCLGVLLGRASSGATWARPAIEQLFTHTYHERSRIPEPLRTKVVNWQADLKRGVATGWVDNANSILESKHVVVDGRETRMSMTSGTAEWAGKQFGFGAETHIG